MKCVWMLLAGLLVLVGQPAWAQREASERGPRSTTPATELPDLPKTEWTLEKLDNPPTREIKFERLDTALPMRLWRPDPALLEQKYAAGVLLQRPASLNDESVLRGDIRMANLALDDDIVRLQFLAEGRILDGVHGWNNHTYHDSFSRFLKQIPQDRLPDAAALAFFQSEDLDLGYFASAGGKPPAGRAGGTPRGNESAANRLRPSEIQIFAPTPEIAEARAKAVLQILDQGSFRPLQVAMFQLREKRGAEWNEMRQKMIDVEAQLKEVRAKLEEYTDFTADMLTGLRLQLLQLEVDLAGAQARLAICTERAKEPSSPNRLAKLEEMKIAAEVEVAGLEASRAKSSKLIETVKTKIELAGKEVKLETDRASLRTRLDYYANAVLQLDVLISQHAPMPLVDGKVIIQPIKWTE